MTCMATPEQTCIVQVILEHEEAFNLRQHRRNETMLKKRILDFIHQLRQRGFRHFIIFINTTVDFWLAELLYFMNRGNRKAAFSYSLYLTPADAENMSEWAVEEYYFDEIIRNAAKIHWCRGHWYMPDSPLMLLDLTCHSTSNRYCR